jgi:hypothetical protein
MSIFQTTENNSMGNNYYSWNTSFCVGFNPKIWAPNKFDEKQ